MRDFKNTKLLLSSINTFSQFFIFSFKSIFIRIHHDRIIEFIWTIAPSVILIMVGIPSLYFLNSTDSLLESEDSVVTVHVCGNQWFWSYASEFQNSSVQFDSYMIAEEDLEIYQLRLLETDTCLLLPEHTPLKFLVTSSDVLHCWAVPSLGIKIDACPGRLNQVLSYILRPGMFYGQCSEICGVNHGFMPISIGVI